MTIKDIKMSKDLMDDGLRETVTLRTVARLIKESNKEFKGLRRDVKELNKTLISMFESLKVGVEQTKEGIRIADTSVKAIDKLAESVNSDVKGT